MVGGRCGALSGRCTLLQPPALHCWPHSSRQGCPGPLQRSCGWCRRWDPLHRLPRCSTARSQLRQCSGWLGGPARCPPPHAKLPHARPPPPIGALPTPQVLCPHPPSLRPGAEKRRAAPRPFAASPSLSPRAHGGWGCGSTSRATRLESALGLARLECAALGGDQSSRAASREQRLPAHASTGRGGCDRGRTTA